MKSIILVSRCVALKKSKKGKSWVSFHFKGAYNGYNIKEVLIDSSFCKNEFEVKGEYILEILILYIEANIIYGKLKRSKNLKKVSLF